MSEVNDILFGPVNSWRKLCKEVTDYILTKAETSRPMRNIYDINRLRPPGSLTLEGLMEHYHLEGQQSFRYVLGYTIAPQVHIMTIDGTIIFGKYEDGKIPLLGGFKGTSAPRSIRDLNLVPNTYSRHYVFTTDEEATTYLQSLS